MNVGKTKVMTTGDFGEVTEDGKDIEVVMKFVFLGALITRDGICGKEVRRRIDMGKAAMGGLTSIWKDSGVTMETKVKLVKVLVFLIVLYGTETWTMRKHERKKIDAFELWYLRRVLRVSWMEIKTNIWIIENIKPEWTPESRVTKAALSYVGHVVRAAGMEDDVMLGRMNGTRSRGRPRQRWLDTLNSPWARGRNFTYRYHLWWQRLVMIFIIGHVSAIYFDMIALSGWQLKIVMSSFIHTPN